VVRQGGQSNADALETVRAVAFSPDGRLLAAGGNPAGAGAPCVAFWEVMTGRERFRVSGHRGDVTSLTFAGTGRTLVTGSDDTTALVWDLWARPPDARADSPLDDREADRLWAALGDEDARTAYDALGRLSRDLGAGLRRAKASVRPVPAGDGARLADLIRALDSPRFADREGASRELAKAGEAAAAAVRKALAGRPATETEARLQRLADALAASTPDRRREARAVELLERVGTPAAMDLLGEWGAGAENAALTEAALAALGRLRRPKGERQ
jgi:hypothetical protein